jgi:hypothetical protein
MSEMPGLALEDSGASGGGLTGGGGRTRSAVGGALVLSDLVFLVRVGSSPLGTLAACSVPQHVVQGGTQRLECGHSRGPVVLRMCLLLVHELAHSLGMHRQEGRKALQDLEAGLGGLRGLLLLRGGGAEEEDDDEGAAAEVDAMLSKDSCA